MTVTFANPDSPREAGLHDGVSAEVYHGDPCAAPSLSASVAKIMIDQSPRHAWTAHPRLNPNAEGEESKRLDIGSAAHRLLLNAGRDLAVIDAENFTTKAAKAERDAAREQGLTPILKKDLLNSERMIDAAQTQLEAAGVWQEFNAAPAEQVIIWQDEGGVWCRSMLDKLHRGEHHAIIYDYKTTSASAHPAALGRLIADRGYDVAAGFYERGLCTLFPEYLGRTTFRWIVQEIEPPYGLTIVELDGAGRVMGAKKAAAAIALWRQCLVLDEWPMYQPAIVRAEYPSWHETRWLERETEDPLIAGLITNPLLPEPARPERPMTEIIA